MPRPHPSAGSAPPEKYNPYDDLKMFRSRLATSRSSKSPSVIALHALTHSRPEIARRILDTAVLEPFYRLLTTEFPRVERLSDDATKLIEELKGQFLQEPVFVLGMLESIFVIERIEPWTRDTIKLASRGKLTLETMRWRKSPYLRRIEANADALSTMDLATYVRERDVRIMLEIVGAVDGRSADEQAARILKSLPKLKGCWDDFGHGRAESILGPDGAKHIVGWIMGHVEF